MPFFFLKNLYLFLKKQFFTLTHGMTMMNEMITCDRNAPSTRLTIPIGRQNPDVGSFLGHPLPWLRHRRYVMFSATRCRQDAAGCRRRRPLILRLQPLSRNILRRLLLLLWLRRRHFSEDYHARLAA